MKVGPDAAYAAAVAFGLLLGMVPGGAHGQISTHIPYNELVNRSKTFAALDENLFGDKVNLQDGSLGFVQDDLVLTTNSRLIVSFGRKTPTANQGLDETFAVFGIDWEPNIPYMMGTYDTRDGWNSGGSQNRCSNGFVPAEHPGPWPYYNTQVVRAHMWWHGVNISVPGYSDEKLLKLNSGQILPTDGKTYYGTTKSGWKVSCLPTIKNGSGEGFVVTLPDGVSYHFDWMATRNAIDLTDNGSVDPNTGDSNDSWHRLAPLTDVYLYATKAVDRFGNTITYTYDTTKPNRITSIASNDGVRIEVDYNTAGQIAAIRSDGKTWSYGYVDDLFGFKRLSSLTMPDTSRWEFAFQKKNPPIGAGGAEGEGGCITGHGTMNGSATPDPSYLNVITMKHPSGATGVFRTRSTIHGTNMTPGGCEYFGSQETGWQVGTYGVPATYVADSSLFDKKLSGLGLTDRTWEYRYYSSWSYDPNSPYRGIAPACANPCPTTSETTVIGSDGVLRRYTFGNNYYTNVGRLLAETVEKGGQVQRRKTYEYVASATGQPFPDNTGDVPVGTGLSTFPQETKFNLYGNPLLFRNRPVTTIKVQQDGFVFQSVVNSFDVFVRPTSVTKSSAPAP